MNTRTRIVGITAATVLTAAAGVALTAGTANAYYCAYGMTCGKISVVGGVGIGTEGNTGGGSTYRVVPGGASSEDVGIRDANAFVIGRGYAVRVQILDPRTGQYANRPTLGPGTHPIGNSDYRLTAYPTG